MAMSLKLSHKFNSFIRKFTLRNILVAIPLILLCVIVANKAGNYVWNHITISPSSSAGAHVFYYSNEVNSSDLTLNKWVRFPLLVPKNIVGTCEPNCSPGKAPDTCICYPIKRIACDQGSVLITENLNFYCDGIFLGKAKTRSKRGVPVTPFQYRGLIPEGYAFLMNDHPDSYDSRYYGIVGKNHVTQKVYPLF